MQINNINTNQNNPKFQAKLDFIGQKNLLPKNALNKLRTKVANIGTAEDTIFVGTCANNIIGSKIEEGFLGRYRRQFIKQTDTIVTTAYVFPSIKKAETVAYTKVTGSANERKINSYKTILKYIDSVKEKFNTINNK